MIKLFDEIPFIEDERIIISRLEESDSEALRNLMNDNLVYRYLPTFLLEKQYNDPLDVIRKMYGECINNKSAIHLGIFLKENRVFCGLAELYGFKDDIHKISLGYRLLSSFWGKHIASDAVRLIIDYLYTKTNIEIITASTMPDNKASEKVLRKNGFDLVVSFSDEDWEFDKPTPADKWIR